MSVVEDIPEIQSIVPIPVGLLEDEEALVEARAMAHAQAERFAAQECVTLGPLVREWVDREEPICDPSGAVLCRPADGVMAGVYFRFRVESPEPAPAA